MVKINLFPENEHNQNYKLRLLIIDIQFPFLNKLTLPDRTFRASDGIKRYNRKEFCLKEVNYLKNDNFCILHILRADCRESQ